MEVGGSRLSPRIGADKMRARVHLEIMASKKLEKGPAVEMEIASQVALVVWWLFMVLARMTCVDRTPRNLQPCGHIIFYSRPAGIDFAQCDWIADCDCAGGGARTSFRSDMRVQRW